LYVSILFEGFLHTELDDLTEIFHILSAGDVRDLAKSLHMPAKGSKKSIVSAIMKETKTQRSVFFTNGPTIQSTIMKRY
jgi:hypothetical protein